MRRRLDLAAALVAHPPVLFLDEPTTGLDPRSRVGLWETIEARVAAGATVLLTTQYLDEADRLADRIAVIDHGRLIAEGTPAALKAAPPVHRRSGERRRVDRDGVGGRPDRGLRAARGLALPASLRPLVPGQRRAVALRGRGRKPARGKVNQMVQQRADRLDAAFAALADPTRRAIVARLAQGEASVSELSEPFDMTLTAVAKHLRVLDRAGLIEHAKQGRVRRCRLVAEPLREVHAWTGAYGRFWEGQLDSLAAHLHGPARD